MVLVFFKVCDLFVNLLETEALSLEVMYSLYTHDFYKQFQGVHSHLEAVHGPPWGCAIRLSADLGGEWLWWRTGKIRDQEPKMDSQKPLPGLSTVLTCLTSSLGPTACMPTHLPRLSVLAQVWVLKLP